MPLKYRFITIILLVPVIFGLTGVSIAEIPVQQATFQPPTQELIASSRPREKTADSTRDIPSKAKTNDEMQTANRLVPRKGVQAFSPITVPGIRVTSLFNEEREGGPHKGLDLAVPVNTPVRAAFTGKFYKGDQGKLGLGRYVYMIHNNGLITYYGHLADWMPIDDGTVVPAGKIIGLSGNSGKSTGPHLHFAIKTKRDFIDPLSFFEVRVVQKFNPNSYFLYKN